MDLKGELAKCGLDVAPERVGRLLLLLDEMLRWNKTINLTAITDREEALEKHIVDSLTLLPLLAGDENILDMGSGGGLPGLALKVARPELRLVSIDAVAKKITFQRHLIRLLALEGVEAVHGRLEELSLRAEYRGRFDVVVARAFSDLASCARLAAPFLNDAGRLLAMKGPEGEGEMQTYGAEIAQHGYTPGEVVRLNLPVSGATRLLIELKRIRHDK